MGPVKFLVGMFAALLAASPAYAETLIFRSGRCPKGDGSCYYSFGPTVETPLFAQIVEINAPGPGVATVTVNGSLQCAYNSYAQGDVGVVDLTGIIAQGQETPQVGGMGTVRLAMRIPPPPGSVTPALSVAANLASTQVVKITKAGKTNFKYWIVRNRMDANTSCTIFDLTMTATFS